MQETISLEVVVHGLWSYVGFQDFHEGDHDLCFRFGIFDGLVLQCTLYTYIKDNFQVINREFE